MKAENYAAVEFLSRSSNEGFARMVAAAFAAFLFGEIPTMLQILGSVLILGGVLLYSRIENQKSTS